MNIIRKTNFIYCIIICILIYCATFPLQVNNKQELKNSKSQIEEKKQIIHNRSPTNSNQTTNNNMILKARVTAYAPLDNKSGICADEKPNITSTGVTPSRDICSVNPTRIPYGTKIYIPGYGDVIAGDTGGSIREYDGYAIDVYMENYDDAINWGVQHLEIIVK